MPHRYIDITTDFGFKRMFGREESKTILKGFLVAMLDLPHPIVELSFIPNEQLPATPAERHGIYDLYCQDQAGNRFIVEMQRSAMKYYKERTLYYATFPITQQVEKGEAYDFHLMPVYCLSILRYQMDDDPDYYQHVQLVNTRTGKVFYKKLTFVYVELPKFTLALEDLTTIQEKWVYLLKHIYAMDTMPDMFSEDPFSHAFHIAEYSALSEEERLLYRQNLKTLSDAQLVLEAKLDEGMAKGMAQGRAEGRTEGRAEGLLTGIETVLDIKFGSGATPLLDTIQQITDLDQLQAILHGLRTLQTLEEVEQLVNQYVQEKGG